MKRRRYVGLWAKYFLFYEARDDEKPNNNLLPFALLLSTSFPVHLPTRSLPVRDFRHTVLLDVLLERLRAELEIRVNVLLENVYYDTLEY